MIIETGAGVDGADSYIDVSSFDSIALNYHAQAPSGSLEHKEAALRRAFLFMASLNWELDFPAFDGEIPANVKTAQGLLAFHEAASPNTLQPAVTQAQNRVLVGVGSLSWRSTAQSGLQAQKAQVTIAMDLLQPFLSNSSNKLLRA